MRVIQFETAVDGNAIQIPAQYVDMVSSKVNVTIVPADNKKTAGRLKTKAMPSSIDEFPAILDTTGWKFDRDEANER